jgi:hypothetical protein
MNIHDLRPKGDHRGDNRTIYQNWTKQNVLHVYDLTVFPQSPISALVVDWWFISRKSKWVIWLQNENVYKVEIIVGRYFLGSYVFNGLVEFHNI